jgi:dGTP triphosphohydrolase
MVIWVRALMMAPSCHRTGRAASVRKRRKRTDIGKASPQLEQRWRLRRIADYIAGMTDRYALVEHARYFPKTPGLR